MEKIIVSACLLGDNCKYNGKSNYNPLVQELKKHFTIVPICPEQMGGLPTPRDKSEIKGDMVVSEFGKNVTSNFRKGRDEVVNICKYLHIKKAVLMERSPSCGVHQVYNGKFNGTLIDGEGVTTKALKSIGVECYTLEEIMEIIKNEKESD